MGHTAWAPEGPPARSRGPEGPKTSSLIYVFIVGLYCPLPSSSSSPLSVIIHHTLSLLSHFPHHCHCHCQLFTTFLNFSQLCTMFKSVHSASPPWFSVLFSSSLSRSHHLRPDLSIFAPDSLFIELSTGVCYRMNDDAFFPVLRGMTAFDYVGFWKKILLRHFFSQSQTLNEHFL